MNGNIWQTRVLASLKFPTDWTADTAHNYLRIDQMPASLMKNHNRPRPSMVLPNVHPFRLNSFHTFGNWHLTPYNLVWNLCPVKGLYLWQYESSSILLSKYLNSTNNPWVKFRFHLHSWTLSWPSSDKIQWGLGSIPFFWWYAPATPDLKFDNFIRGNLWRYELLDI